MKVEIEPRQPVRLTILRDPEIIREGRILSLIGKQLRLEIVGDLQAGTPLKVEWGKYLMLAEVAGMEHASSVTVAVLEVHHSLLDVEELARRRQAWL